MSSLDSLTPVPLTLEGSSLLHQMLRVRWPEWRALAAVRRDQLLTEAGAAIQQMDSQGSALFSLLGHKGDLMLVHFRQNFEQLGEAERALQKLPLWDFLEQTSSYLSVVELDCTNPRQSLRRAGRARIEPHTPEWNAEIQDAVRQRQAMHPRLFRRCRRTSTFAFTDGPAARRRQELVSASLGSGSGRWAITALSAGATRGK
jgi:chlorite dismutase